MQFKALFKPKGIVVSNDQHQKPEVDNQVVEDASRLLVSTPTTIRRWDLNQTLRIMRLTALFLFAACLEVQAHGYSQAKLTVSEKDAPLPKVFQAIERQSDYHFFYDYSVFEQAAKVTVRVKNASIEQVLNVCFKDQPLTYSIEGKLILVKRKAPETAVVSESRTSPENSDEISGLVTGEDGVPLQGATVTIKSINIIGSTNAKGEFATRGVEPGKYQVEVSFIGYEKATAEVIVELKKGGKFFIKLKQALHIMDETVIKGYYNTTQRLNTGDVTTVKGEDLNKEPVSDPLEALEGRVPGLEINQGSGAPGRFLTVQLRGQNTITAGSQPLYVIDGVPFFESVSSSYGTSLTFDNPNLGGSGGGATSSPLDVLSLNEIEAITVLKDADATAIYGSRGANGVILISTKKGKRGITKVDGQFYSGIGKVTKTYDLLNSQQYLAMRHEAFSNDSIATTSSAYMTAYDINGTWDTTRYTDWQKYYLGNNAQYTDAQASVSGGNDYTQFFIGSGYHRETTILPATFNDTKGDVHLSLSHRSENNRFITSISVSYSAHNTFLPTNTGNSTISPDAPSIYNPNGSLNWANSTWTNPASYWLQTARSVTDLLNTDLQLSYQLFQGLTLKSNFGYNDAETNQTFLFPLASYDPAVTSQQSSSEFGINSYKGWIIEPQISYQKKIAQGRLEVLGGTTFQQQIQNSSATTGTGYSTDALLNDLAAATSVTLNGVSSSLYRYNAFFGRVSYNWAEKYILNLTGRRDGSSRFAPGRQFANFGAVGAAWVFTQEKFIQAALPFLSFGKIRGSYGLTGNDQIGDYGYLATYKPQGGGATYLGVVPLNPTGLPNSLYGWETTKKSEVAMDLGFLKDRILITANYYLNRSSNLLTKYALPSITGATSITENFPAVVQNTGAEFTISSSNLTSKDFTWRTSVNLTVPIEQAKLIAYPGLATSSYANSYVIGKSIFIAKLLKYTGVDKATGLYTFYDYNKDGRINYPTDAQDVVFTGQQWYGGMNNSFTYKGFQLDVFIQWVERKNRENMLANFSPGMAQNIPKYIYDHRWQHPGDNGSIQRLYVSNSAASAAFTNFTYYSSGVYSNGSFGRLKNVVFSYTLATKWTHAIKLQNIRVFVQGQNLLTFTHYLGLDPETTGLPPLRVITGGIHVGF